MYEMLTGHPPFFSDEPSTTCQKIINWKKNLIIPNDIPISNSAKDLIKRLIND